MQDDNGLAISRTNPQRNTSSPQLQEQPVSSSPLVAHSPAALLLPAAAHAIKNIIVACNALQNAVVDRHRMGSEISEEQKINIVRLVKLANEKNRALVCRDHHRYLCK